MIHPIKHFKTITRHRIKVYEHCVKAGIPWQGLVHDLSKYSPSEFIRGAIYYVGNQSPNTLERKTIGTSMTWLHHKGRNKHHFEYWVDYQPASRKQGPVRMPDKYLIEMFCDRVAASKIYQGDNYTQEKPLEYFEKGFAKNAMHPESARVLESWLTMLATQGEDATFKYIKGLHQKVYR